MSTLKEKTQVFVVGLLIGLLVAGVFFVFKLDDYFKELNFYKHFAETFSIEKKNESEAEKNDKKADVKKQEKPPKKESTDKIENTEKVAAVRMDSTAAALVDSLSMNTGTLVEDEIIVKKDELIISKTIEIISINTNVKNSGKDSILHHVSGINEDKEKPFLNIEFWKSPLNYKGYKLSKYKLVVYGVNPSDAFKIFKLDESIYLKNTTGTYRFDITSDFRAYDRVTDESILSKLR